MRWVLMLSASCFCACHLLARQGVVETRDGHLYEGHIRLDLNRVVVANTEAELLTYVDLTNLAELSFERDIPPSIGQSALAEMLPGTWQSEDIGSARLAGHAASGSGLFRLTSSGTNIFGQSDAFHFVYQPVKGDSEIEACVIQVPYALPWAKAGLMMRESLTAGSRNVLLAVTSARMGAFQWREGEGETTNAEMQRDMSVPNWIRLRRQGNTFSASKSRNGRQWKLAGRVSIPMTGEIFVGMAAAGADESTSDSERRLPSNCSTIANVRQAPFLPNDSFVPVVQLNSGSMPVGRIRAADQWRIHLAGAPPPPPIPTVSVARILFRWLPFGLTGRISSGQPGVLLTSGEFVEGQFLGIEQGRVKISSVLLGWREFDLNNELIALVLRKSSAAPQPCEVKTVDGSTWLGTLLEINSEHVVLQEPSLGIHRIAFHELLEVKRRAESRRR